MAIAANGGIVAHDAGAFKTPTDSGAVAVTELGFEPDLLLFTATNNVNAAETPLSHTDGWTYGKAAHDSNETIIQNVVSVAEDTRSTDTAIATARSDQVIDLLMHDDKRADGLVGSVTQTTADGFEIDFDASAVTGSANESYTVLFQAFETVDKADVDVGYFTTPTEESVQTVDLRADADYMQLTAVEPLGKMDTEQVTGSRLGISHGAAAREASLEQHVITSEIESSPLRRNSDAAFDDRAIHLLYGEGDDIDGRTSARVTHLGKQLELTYDDVCAPTDSPDSDKADADTAKSVGGKDGSDAPGASPRLVTYVAVDTGDGPAPAIDHFEVPAPDEGPKRFDAGFEPAVVEFIVGTADEVGHERSAANSPLSFGWSHGVALMDPAGTVDHHVLHSSVSGDEVSGSGPLEMTTQRGATAGSTGDASLNGGASTTDETPSPAQPGAGVVALTLDNEGRVLGREKVRVTGIDRTGFHVGVEGVDVASAAESSGRRPVVFYTAWPQGD